MEPSVNDNTQTTTSETTVRSWGTGAALSLVTLGVLILATAYYVHTTRETLESRLADLDSRVDARFAEQNKGTRQDIATLTTDLAAVTERVELAAREAEAARALATTLKRAHDSTARTATTQAADVKAIQQTVATLATDMNTKIAGVSTELTKIGDSLTSARNDVTDNRRQLTSLKAEVGAQISENTKAVAELQRLGGHQWFDVDVSKSSRENSPKVADVRIQLAKTDVRRGKYDLVLHFDDRQIERKDRTIGEPVQFLVGPERQRYELVVTDMERDRIRGYLSVSNASAMPTRQVAVR
jgi:chromosome segregation ATPase